MSRLAPKLLLAALLCAMASAPASARGHGGRGGGHHGGGHSGGGYRHHAAFGVVAVAPVFAPFYFPGSSYVYYPPRPSFPTLYIERGSDTSAPGDAPIYWYYCPEAQRYYPDVQTCPLGWQQMVSQPPPQS